MWSVYTRWKTVYRMPFWPFLIGCFVRIVCFSMWLCCVRLWWTLCYSSEYNFLCCSMVLITVRKRLFHHTKKIISSYGIGHSGKSYVLFCKTEKHILCAENELSVGGLLFMCDDVDTRIIWMCHQFLTKKDILIGLTRMSIYFVYTFIA